MKEFRVENVVMDTTIIVTLYKPPYEDDDILKYKIVLVEVYG